MTREEATPQGNATGRRKKCQQPVLGELRMDAAAPDLIPANGRALTPAPEAPAGAAVPAEADAERTDNGSSHGAGAFTITAGDGDFKLEPRDIPGPIPEDQREIAVRIYETWGILKLLREQKVFTRKDADGPSAFDEFHQRLIEVAEIGLAASHVKTKIAARALEQIRNEISLRVGVAIKLEYLSRMAIWAVLGGLVGTGLILLSKFLLMPALSGYGLVVMGSMAGAWMSVAATQRKVAFNQVPHYLGSSREALVRLMFVALLASTLVLFLEAGIVGISITGLDFQQLYLQPGAAFLVGVIAGLGERAVSVRLIEQSEKILTSSLPEGGSRH